MPGTAPTFPDDLSSGEELGCIPGDGGATFRVFAPRATSVTLALFDRVDAPPAREVPMEKKAGGIWEAVIAGEFRGTWYGYRVDGPRGPGEMFDPSVIVADPYSRAVSTKNTWRMEARSLIAEAPFDWGDDACPLPEDRAALVIYECHVRDLTARAGATGRGSYAALAEPRGKALRHVRSLGVNAVEFLPLMKFGTAEIPYRDTSVRSDGGKVNDWNPYARNHWGYMTSFFFAPETYYASGWTAEPGRWNGTDARAAAEFKGLVRALHREGIAVIMDVVYNHTSHYDYNPFKYIDKHYYYHCDDEGRFLEASGCGNDFHTGRPMGARVILDSLEHWMREYHVDGFRFDLAAMIDESTCAMITERVKSINPGAVLIAEPWGGGDHHPPRFDALGWSSWNDRYRDTIKGRDPVHGRGAIFGEPGGGQGPLRDALLGSPKGDGGLFSDARNGVSYLASHDGYTLGDFIRIATGEFDPGHRFDPGVRPGPPSGQPLSIHKLAAVLLLTSPGPVMIHEGQEFARSKVIARDDAPDPDAGTLDHNSYNKDNDTNHIDYGDAAAAKGLVGTYRDLIALRKRHPALAGLRGTRSVVFPGEEASFAAVTIADESPPAPAAFDRYIILLNFHPSASARYDLPAGRWRTLAGPAGVSRPGKEPPAPGSVPVPPSAGVVLGRVTSRGHAHAD